MPKATLSLIDWRSRKIVVDLPYRSLSLSLPPLHPPPFFSCQVTIIFTWWQKCSPRQNMIFNEVTLVSKGAVRACKKSTASYWQCQRPSKNYASLFSPFYRFDFSLYIHTHTRTSSRPKIYNPNHTHSILLLIWLKECLKELYHAH